MNVLMISDVYFPRINGVSTSIESFRRALPAQGIHSTLVAPAYPAGDETEAGIVRIPSRYLPIDPEDRLMRRDAIRRMAGELAGRRFDLVHVHTPFVAHYAGLELARALGVPCVASYHTFFEEYLFHYVRCLPRGLLRALARGFSRRQCNSVDAVIVPSQAMADALRRYGVRRPLTILPTGLAEGRFHGGDGRFFRERYGIAAERKLLLFVGRVAREKNIGFLLEVADRLRRRDPSILLLVTGEGPALAGLAGEVERRTLGDHVRFLGYLDRNHELRDCYRAADLFVFASRTETQGLVLLEAMALGTPVVALADMGTRDILDGERGCRIAPPDPAGFAEVVAELLADPDALRRMGEEARHRAQGWRAEEMARRLADCYRGWAGGAAGVSAAPHPA